MDSRTAEALDRIQQHPRLVIADDYEIAAQVSTCSARKFCNGELVADSNDDSVWLSVRLIHRKRPGWATTFFRTKDAIEFLVQSAFQSAESSSPDPWFRFPKWKSSLKCDPRVAPGSVKPTVPFESRYSALVERPDILEEDYERWDTDTVLFRREERCHLMYNRSLERVRIHVAARGPGESVRFHREYVGSAGFNRIDSSIKELTKVTSIMRSATTPNDPSARFLLLSPAAAARLLSKMASWFSAAEIQIGRSPLLTEVVPPFSPALTLVDDGGGPSTAHAAPFDLEGCPTQRTVLVEKGQLRSLLYDTHTGMRDNHMSTGNLLRYPHWSYPQVAAANIFIEPVPGAVRNVCEGISDGIFLYTIDCLEPMVGVSHGYYATGHGWRIRHGCVQEPLRDVVVRLDISSVLRGVLSTGNDLEFFGGCGAPSILLENIPLGS